MLLPPACVAANPNGRRASRAVDHGNGDLPVFESGAVLLYLAERDPQRRLLPAEPAARQQALSWLFWQMVGGEAWGQGAAAGEGRGG